MYISKSIIDGLKILGFDKESIKSVSREKSLEEIFLSTLFLNYVLVLVIFILTTMTGGASINGRALNMPVIYGILMMYPFTYNLLIYLTYGLFGLMAEMLNKKSHIKPLLSVGFHTAITYSVVFYIIAIIATSNLMASLFLSILFIIWFIFTMFLSISVIYKFSLPQTLIIVFLPLLLISIIILILLFIYPNLIRSICGYLFI